ncbi:syntaxin-1A [Trichonephila inaurata madagascariensis]|uniref:Syntaxin-1A n=1 Tax=Trichonephila inaurata madagascariensis TaxID=2747483 RepID=A0A8X7BY80_9ARAC|nr:syntaxin-1A [Trichonephila inaurata madagascariensis]
MEEKSRKLFARIEANIDEMEECISEIKKKHNKILSSPFHDEEDFHELDRLMAKIQSYSANTWSLLKAVKQTRQKDSVRRSSIRMETVQLSSLTQKFLDTLADYSAAQTSYRERKKKLLKKQLEITGQEVDEEQLEKMLDENRAVFTQDYIVEVERAREDLTDVKQRGEIIDSIEQHVIEASEDVRDGNKEITSAAKKNAASRKKLFIVIALVVLLICIIIIIVVALYA